MTTEYFSAINPKQTMSYIAYDDFASGEFKEEPPDIGFINYALNCPTQCSGLYRRNPYATPQWHKEYANNGLLWDGNFNEQFFWSNLPDGGTSAWWAVDLGQKVIVNRIRVWYMLDEHRPFATGVCKTYVDGKLSIEIETERIAEHGQDKFGGKYYDLILRDGTAYLPAIDRVVLYSQFGQYLKIFELQVLGAIPGTETPEFETNKLLQKRLPETGSWTKNKFGDRDCRGNIESYSHDTVIPTSRHETATIKSMYINEGQPTSRDYTVWADIYFHLEERYTIFGLVGRATSINYYIALYDVQHNRFSLGRRYKNQPTDTYREIWYLKDSYFYYEEHGSGQAHVIKRVKMVFSGDQISAYYDGRLIATVTDQQAYNDIGLAGIYFEKDATISTVAKDIGMSRFWIEDKSYQDNKAGVWENLDKALVIDSKHAGANMQGLGKTQYIWVIPDWSKYPHKDRMTELKMRITGSVSQSFFLKFAFALQDTANHTRYISYIDQLPKYSEGYSMTDTLMSHEISITDPEILKNWDKIIGVIWAEGNSHTIILDGIEFKTSYIVPRNNRKRFSIVY